MIGYEVNEEWWDSPYSNPQFIKLQFPVLPSKNLLYPDYALLFCYFNNGPAFQDYVKNYSGVLVFIIGPAYGSGRHTDPAPFKPDFGEENWELIDAQEVKNTKDFIAVYLKKTR